MSKGSFIKGLAAGAVVGAAVGVATGLLTAKKSGKELRKDLMEYAAKVRKDIETAMKNASSFTKETYKKVVDQATDAYNKVKKLDKKDLEAVKDTLVSEWETVSKKVKKAVAKKK